MQLNQLRTFTAIVETGSIRAAARRLGVSQPSATKSLRALEQDLDTQLVQRHSRGIALTPAGKALLAHARAAQAELQKARAEIDELAGRARESVTMGVASIVGAWLVPPVLAAQRARSPESAVRVLEGTQESLLPMLREGAIDFAVCLRLEPESTRGFTVRNLARFRLTVVGRKGHPLRQARRLEELREAHWIMTRPRGAGGALEHAFRAAGLALPASATECDSHAIKIALLAGSDALGLVGRPMLGEASVRALLEEIPIEPPFPLMTVSLYTRSDTPPGPPVRALAALVALQCRTILRMN
ncbi:LysR family transcriptional regulator [Ramlibacter rhizophilus]|uniref:LysR family transcriptional regulator n=1 Tax=Ramlibacter rhizophilus TaxID=1781167 RepID=A0A4Z0BPN9_9BURK|nr:LysR substrate-binding domain-containing protein [Ramlibacter rhizophilus]TFZ01263.1 LysR family transcriptional regulator [Ramlibacter rhizophilus]